jgi:hypothetical protein
MSNIPENVLVDDCDREMLEAMGKWHISSGGYCVRRRPNTRMHRVIMQPPDNLFVDHINGNKLDNRRENLRIVTNQQNQWNQTRAKGYYWNAERNKWQVTIVVNKKNIFLGRFDTEEQARQAYLNAKQELHKI